MVRNEGNEARVLVNVRLEGDYTHTFVVSFMQKTPKIDHQEDKTHMDQKSSKHPRTVVRHILRESSRSVRRYLQDQQ